MNQVIPIHQDKISYLTYTLVTINNHFRHQWWSIKMPRTKMTVCYGKITNLTLRSKVTNNGTQHIVWRRFTYMSNMKSLSWMTKKLQPGHDLYDLLRTHRPVWPWGQRSPTMVHDTSSGGGLPTCQIWKACLEWQKSYSPDTICYGRTDGGTDRMITIGALITFHCAWDLHRMPLIDWNPACLCILYIQENHMVVLPDCNSDDIKSYSQRNCLYRLLLSGNEWVSDCCLTPSKHDLIFIVLAHWNNIPWVEMSLRLVILSWFRANQSLCSYSLTLHA